MDALKPFIAKVADGAALGRTEAATAFGIIMSGEASPAQIAAFLIALRMRGETTDEITGAAEVMRAKALPVTAPPGAIDTCGTGGDASGTFNISTCTAFVLAGGGIPVAKHGNRSISSRSGSADVLVALGVKLDVGPDVIARSMREAGVGFMFAPAHHSAMRHVGPVRQELGLRTIFNLLGPLSNPAGARRQVIGVFSRRWLVAMAETLRNLGSERVWVVHGSDGLDELTTTGPTHVAELRDGRVTEFEVNPSDAGLAITEPAALKGGDAVANAAAIREVLSGRPGAFRDIVLLNAAAGFIVADRAGSLAEGTRLAAQSIDSGAAGRALERLVAVTNG
ncbi:MAG: anthranilate phosphoribosyltransferase [Rhizobiales bacterium]|nr:anthranilate phosphoribosyltransferase [Hyphomicrobiales bacterium]